MGLRDGQEQAVDALYERDRAIVMAPVGAGKTATILTAMQAMLDDGLVTCWLVVAPKRVCVEVWAQEAAIWTPRLRLALAVGSPAQRDAALASNVDAVVINYDNLQTLTDLSGFDGIVFDELTRLKNPSGKRFKALEKLLEAVPVRWGMTGSFTSNGLEDCFGQCKIVDQKLLGRSKGAFLQQYFHCVNRDFGQWEPRDNALAQVMERIKPAVIMLDNEQYRDSLPPCHIVPVMIPLDEREPYEKMKRDYVARFPDDTVIAQNAAAVTNKLQQMASGFAYGTGQQPLWYSGHKFDRLDELLEENQRANTIVVYNYLEELAELKRRYPKAWTIDMPGAVEQWNAGRVELLLIHPKSAGHGLNLQSGGSQMVFLSLPWSLELYEQTIGRLHRGGQKNSVWVYILLTERTIDERIFGSLADKRTVSDLAMEELRQ